MRNPWKQYKRENGIQTPRRDGRTPVNAGWQARESVPWTTADTTNRGQMRISRSNKNGQLTGREARRSNGYKKGAKAGFRRRNKAVASYAAYIESTRPPSNHSTQ